MGRNRTDSGAEGKGAQSNGADGKGRADELKKVTVRLPRELLDDIDRLAEAETRTRSNYLEWKLLNLIKSELSGVSGG